MTTIYTPRTEAPFNGDECSGTDGDVNRTYILAYSSSVAAGFSVIKSDVPLTQTTHYTVSNGIITFLVAVYDNDVIELSYFTTTTITDPSASLSSNLRIVERAGYGIRIVDEVVGTGNSVLASYDLDGDFVIEGSYTLNVATSGSNSFTELTENTDYVLDLDSGKILLTAAGVTALGTKVLYATYVHLDASSPMNNSVITQFRSDAEARLSRLTNKYWSETEVTELVTGFAQDTYPHTDEPFSSSRSRYQYFVTNAQPIQKINAFWFLNRTNNTFANVTSDDGGSYTDNTSAASVGTTAFNVFATVPAVNDALYIGMSNKFLGVYSRLQTLGTDAGSLAVTWEYYDGSSWASLSSVTAGTTGSDKFTASGFVSWAVPSAWTATTINSSASLYFVRARLSAGSYTIAPKLWEIYPNPDKVIGTEISVRNLTFTPYGRVTVLNNAVPDGVSNLSVQMTCGVTSSDREYSLGVDLLTVLGALQIMISATGGSYNDETSFTLGGKAVTVGEVYVNVREVVKQLTDEINDLKALVGMAYHIGGGAVN